MTSYDLVSREAEPHQLSTCGLQSDPYEASTLAAVPSCWRSRPSKIASVPTWLYLSSLASS